MRELCTFPSSRFFYSGKLYCAPGDYYVCMFDVALLRARCFLYKTYFINNNNRSYHSPIRIHSSVCGRLFVCAMHAKGIHRSPRAQVPRLLANLLSHNARILLIMMKYLWRERKRGIINMQLTDTQKQTYRDILYSIRISNDKQYVCQYAVKTHSSAAAFY